PAGGVVSMGRGFKAASGPDPPAGRRAEPSFQQLDLYALAPVRRGAGQRADRVYDPAAAADDAARVVRGARHLDDEGAVGALGPHLQAIGLLYQVHEAVVDEVDDHLEASGVLRSRRRPPGASGTKPDASP